MYICTICHNEISKEASNGSAGDHDPAFHVAKAYHTPHKIVRGIITVCRSDFQPWPCETHQRYR